MATGSRRPDAAHRIDAAVVAALSAAGLRLTRHRGAVLVALAQAGKPLGADEVVSRSTVPTSTGYRILADLCVAGVVERLAGSVRSDRYELAEAFSRRHHHHLLCTSCGSISDFEPSPKLERMINGELATIGEGTGGFVPTGHLFDVRGLCSDCAA